MRFKLVVLMLVLGVPPAAARGDDAAFLPDASVRLMAARYQPTETDLDWTGWIGAGLGLFRVLGTTAYGDADVETILGNTRRAFEATQANYHLELGARHSFGRWGLTAFFHHTSRHYVDRPKVEAVDWNFLGARVSASSSPRSSKPARVSLGVAHTTLASLVGYRWEITLRGEATLFSRSWGGVYGLGNVRVVTAEPSTVLPRGDFVDRSLEAGARWTRSGRTLSTFVAYEYRNDVFLEAPGARSRALLGLRLGYTSDER